MGAFLIPHYINLRSLGYQQSPHLLTPRIRSWWTCCFNFCYFTRGRGASIWVGGQKFDKILNLPHYAWMTDKIVRPKELLIPPKNSPLYLKLWTKIYKYILTKNSKIQMRKFHLSKKWGAKAPPAPRRRDRCLQWYIRLWIIV